MKNVLFGLLMLVGVIASTPAKAQYVVVVPVVPVVLVPVYPVYSCRYVGPYLVWTVYGYQYQYQLVCGY